MTKPLSRVTTLCLCLIAVVGCQTMSRQNSAGGESGSDVGSSEPAAEVNGRKISMSELDAFIKDELFARSTKNGDASKLYEVRSDAVQRMIDDRVIQEAAEAAGVPREQFLADEIIRQGDVTDEEVSDFFDNLGDKRGEATLEQLSPRIRDHLRQLRTAEVLVSLRERAGARILLEAARVEVAAVGPSLGPEDAAVTIIEFSDFQCPFCQRALPTIREIRKRYPDQVRIVYRHLPLDRIHSRARPAAEASACADQQGKFWEYHDVVFENNKNLSDDDLEKYASELGLEMESYRQCVSERETQQVVQTDAAAAASIGLSGTPAFFVNGILLSGAKPVSDFVTVIDAELAHR